MAEAAIIFPHQLFHENPCLKKERIIYLVEDQWFFHDPVNQIKFHQQKLMLHRASMQAYRELLENRGFRILYLEFAQDRRMGHLFERLRQDQIGEIVTCHPLEQGLTERLTRLASEWRVKLTFLTNPGFLCSQADIKDYFQTRKKYQQTSFYIYQRRQRNILLENSKPVGGRWTYDPLNRKKLPRNFALPGLPDPDNEPYASAARDYVSLEFSDHPGETSQFIYPVTHAGAQKWLDDFIFNRLAFFGDYQDAISNQEPYLFHSLLSPLLNIGLLTPSQVLDAALSFAREHPIPLNSLEGFVRQILGWREYVRAVYVLEGATQRAGNFWGHTRTLPQNLYTGTTRIPPVDVLIDRLLSTAYAHHIERLMVLGNFMLLTEIDPRAVYRWFMEMFIDSYDWVMVPNVYGMSQFADGGLIMTKPYVSGSNYLRKMSDHPPGPWCDIWDGLFWRFIEKHQKYFQRNPRSKPLTRILNRMPRDRRRELIKKGEDFLVKL